MVVALVKILVLVAAVICNSSDMVAAEKKLDLITFLVYGLHFNFKMDAL